MLSFFFTVIIPQKSENRLQGVRNVAKKLCPSKHSFKRTYPDLYKEVSQMFLKCRDVLVETKQAFNEDSDLGSEILR